MTPTRFGDSPLTVQAAPVFATVITAAVMVGYLAGGLGYVAFADPDPVRVTVASALFVLVFGLQIGVISDPRREPDRPAAVAAFAALVAVFGLTPWFGFGWLVLTGFLAGSALLVLPRRLRWPAFGVVVLAAVVGTAYLDSADPRALSYVAVVHAGTGLTIYGLTRLRQLALELECARAAEGELAAERERLRLAQELHGTIGERLSSVVLRSELARRLLARDAERAAAEAAGIVETARSALAEVRATARRYRAPRLDDALCAARATLEAAGIRCEVRVDTSPVPADVGAVLVTALRVAVDEILGADGARRCALVVSRSDGDAALEVTDDGEEAARPVPPDLRRAVEAVDGSLVRSSAAGVHRFRVDVPIPDGAGEPDGDRGTSSPRSAALLRLPLARLLLVVVLSGIAFNSAMFALFGGAEPGPLAARGIASLLGVAAVVAILGLQLGVVSRRGVSARHRWAALAAMAGLSAGSIALLVYPYVGMPGFVAGSALLVVPGRARWAVAAAVIGAVAAVLVVLDGTPLGVLLSVVATVNHGLVVFALTRLQELVDTLQEARADVAALAVTRERLRFAGDLHDLLGYGLSAITLKSELAARLARVDVARARSELDDVRNVAVRALVDVRAVAGPDQQALDLAAEIRSVRSVLTAAGVEMRLDPAGGPDLTGVGATVLATVLREAVTNLLRHSDARCCTIRFTVADVVELEIVNDGVRRAVPDVGPGTGLASLTARVEAVAGVLTAGRRDGDRFGVRVRMPTDSRAGATPALVPPG